MSEIMNLHEAIKNGNTEAAINIINDGADIHAVDRLGYTSLHEAAFHGHIDVVNSLLYRGADIEVRDIDGCTPLHKSAFRGNTDVVMLLIERGANIEAFNQFGQNTLYGASLHDRPEIIEILINHGAKTEVITNYGETPLMCAIEHKHLECIIKLAKESTKDFIELSTQNGRLIEYLKEQYIIAASESTKKPGFIASIKNFINDKTRIDTSLKDCAKALFGMETTLKAKALLKIKIGALRSGVKDAYIITLKFLHVFTKFNLLAENINHIIGFVGLYDAPVDLNDILSDLSPKLSRSILGECRTSLALNQCGTDIKSIDNTNFCIIS